MSSVTKNTVNVNDVEAKKHRQEESKARLEKMEAKSKRLQEAMDRNEMAWNNLRKKVQKSVEENEKRVADNGGKKMPNRFEIIEAKLDVLTFGFNSIKADSEKSTALASQLESTVKSFTERVEECEAARIHDYEEIRQKDREIEQLKWQCRQQEIAIEFLTRRLDEMEKRLGMV